MLFNTFDFFIFLGFVFLIYVTLQHKAQNRFLLVASYSFYAAWDYRFLGLIILSTSIDFLVGNYICTNASKKNKKRFLFISIITNMSILGFFKYFNFFIFSFIDLVSIFGWNPSPLYIKILLPVGISFYTFQSMSYTIDCYRGQIKSTKNILDYALYVSFFPQLVAGPIERASQLLPQVLNPRKITSTHIHTGLWLILWGLLLKSYCADNLASIVDSVYSQKAYNGISVIIASYAYTFQILGDFAGYSCIAKGVASLLGFKLSFNFNLPYFAVNPREFWQRWHITLSTWLRDYLYIPLGGSRGTKTKTAINLMITMVLGGLWHGASLLFILWGTYHGILLILHRLLHKKNTMKQETILTKAYFLIKLILFFQLTVLGWIIFRSQNTEQFFKLVYSIFQNFNILISLHTSMLKQLFLFITPVLLIQVFQFVKKDLLAILKLPLLTQSIVYVAMLYLIILWGVHDAKNFIYFQF